MVRFVCNSAMGVFNLSSKVLLVNFSLPFRPCISFFNLMFSDLRELFSASKSETLTDKD